MIKTWLRVSGLALLAPLLLSPLSATAQDLIVSRALTDAELAGEQGRAGLQMLQMSGANQTATLTGNSANGAVTGSNLIGEGAFADSSGFATVIQNTGNNVIIQDNLIINVSVVQ